MTIGSVGSSFMQGVSGISTPQGLPPVSTGRTDTDGDGSGSRVQMSPRGQFLSKLQQVASSDPAQATRMLTDLETTLRGRASSAGGARGAQLGKLADTIHQAATSGDYSALMKEAAQQSPARGGGAAYHAAATTWTSR